MGRCMGCQRAGRGAAARAPPCRDGQPRPCTSSCHAALPLTPTQRPTHPPTVWRRRADHVHGHPLARRGAPQEDRRQGAGLLLLSGLQKQAEEDTRNKATRHRASPPVAAAAAGSRVRGTHAPPPSPPNPTPPRVKKQSSQHIEHAHGTGGRF